MMKRRTLTFVGLVLGLCCTVLMQTFVATSMPTIVAELGHMALYSWVFASYMTATCAVIPVAGWLGDRLGRRSVLLGGLALFMLGSVLAARSPSMAYLVLFRALQGAGAGLLGTAALAAIGDLFTGAQCGRYYGIASAVQVCANIIGPVIGGWAIAVLGWRQGFLLILPVCGLSALAVLTGLNRVAQTQQGGPLPPASRSALAMLRLLAAPLLCMASGGSFLLGLIQYGAVVYLPLLVQGVRGGTALDTATIAVPMVAGVGLSSLIGGRLVHRWAYHQLTMVGLLVAATGLCGLALTATAGAMWVLQAGALITGAGSGLYYPALLVAAQEAGGEAQRGLAVSLVHMARNLGGAVGVPALGLWLTAALPDSIRHIFAALAAAGAVGAVCAGSYPRWSGAAVARNPSDERGGTTQ